MINDTISNCEHAYSKLLSVESYSHNLRARVYFNEICRRIQSQTESSCTMQCS